MSKRRAAKGQRPDEGGREAANLEVLQRKLVAHWPEARDRAHASELLNAYADNEPSRVRLAIVKLSEGKLDELERYVKAAQLDYRDVLLWAEYPNSAREGPPLSQADDESRARRSEAQRLDARQYREWREKG